MKPILDEKRLFPRINIKLPLRYRLVGARDIHETRIKDVSVVGLGFVAEKFIAPDANLRLELAVPLKVINPTGKVVWAHRIPHSDRYRVGIEFIKINYDERCELADCIDSYLFNYLKKG